MREAPLTLTTLAALVPDRDIDWRLVDGSVERVPLDAHADLVGISVITGTANEAYAMADHFRARGIPVVLGGVHVTILPDEAARHADSIVVGFAERAWPRLVADFRAGAIRRVYREIACDDDILRALPIPRRDLQRPMRYMMPNTVHATRGCRHTCDFCSVPTYCPSFTKRPVADVVDEVRRLPGRYFCFNDVSLADDPDYAHELFTALIPLKKRWGGLTTVEIVDNPALLDVMARSGCRYLLLGFESLNQDNLRGIYKGFNKAVRYRDIVQTLHGHGISVQGCFVFGFDGDDSSVFRTTVDQVLDMRLDIPRYSIYTPYPGTLLFQRLQAEGRILSRNWDDYDTMHVVFRPRRMTPEALYDGFKWAYGETFRLQQIVRRTAGGDLRAVINLAGNLAYRIFVRRLYHEPRFARPCTPLPSDTHRAEATA